MPYYFYMCDMIPNAEHWRVSVARGAGAAARRSWATCRASRRRASSATCRSSASAGCTSSTTYDRERGISYWTKNYRTGIELDDPEALTAPVRVLRPDRHAAGRGPGVVARARRRRAVTATRRRWSPLPRPGPPPRRSPSRARAQAQDFLDRRRTPLVRRRQHHDRAGAHVGRGADLGQQGLEVGRRGHPDLEDVRLLARDAVARLDRRERLQLARARRPGRPGRAGSRTRRPSTAARRRPGPGPPSSRG